MKVLFLTAGPRLVASSRARVYQYLPYLAREGIEAKVIPLVCQRRSAQIIHGTKIALLEGLCDKIISLLNAARFLFYCVSYDTVFIQKIILPVFLFNIIRAINGNIIFDFDDAVFLNDFGASALSKRFEYMLGHSLVVIASNAFLAKKAGRFNKRVHVLASPVEVACPAALTGPKPGRSGCLVIGWIGSPQTSVYLKDLEPVFNRLIEKFKQVSFKFIGADGFYRGREKFTVIPWDLERSGRDLASFDIGIMPLRDDPWCRGKAGYKLLQYMAAGVASIASPVGVNKEIISDGVNGLLADTAEEWFDKFCMLINDAGLRQRLAANARDAAQESFSYEANFPKLLGILRSISKN